MNSLDNGPAQNGLQTGTISGRDFYKKHVEDRVFKDLKRWRWDNIKAMDISTGGYSVAKEIEGHGVSPESIVRLSSGVSRVIKLSNLATGFQPESIDLVTANMTLHHMSDRRLRSTIGRLSELLKTGGELVFVGPNPEVHREVPRNHFRVRQQMHMHLWERFNPGYVDTIRSAAPSLGLSYVEMPSLMAPKYNPDSEAAVSYWPYGTAPMRVAGLLIKPPNKVEDIGPWLLEGAEEPVLELETPPIQRLLEAVN